MSLSTETRADLSGLTARLAAERTREQRMIADGLPEPLVAAIGRHRDAMIEVLIEIRAARTNA